MYLVMLDVKPCTMYSIMFYIFRDRTRSRSPTRSGWSAEDVAELKNLENQRELCQDAIYFAEVCTLRIFKYL